MHVFAQIFLHRYFCSPVFGGFIIAGGDLSRSHYSRLLGAPLIYCMGDILTPPALYIVTATQINRNERDHQTMFWMQIRQKHWAIGAKKGNLQTLIKSTRLRFANFKPIACLRSISIVSDPYQLSPPWMWSQKIFISCHSISIGLIRISFVWTERDHSSKP